MQLLQGTLFRGCSHSVMFRLPCSLGPQVAPTAEAHSLRAAGPFTPRNEHVVTHMSCGIATYLNRAIDMAGLSPAGLQPCRLLPRSLGAIESDINISGSYYWLRDHSKRLDLSLLLEKLRAWKDMNPFQFAELINIVHGYGSDSLLLEMAADKKMYAAPGPSFKRGPEYGYQAEIALFGLADRKKIRPSPGVDAVLLQIFRTLAKSKAFQIKQWTCAPLSELLKKYTKKGFPKKAETWAELALLARTLAGRLRKSERTIKKGDSVNDYYGKKHKESISLLNSWADSLEQELAKKTKKMGKQKTKSETVKKRQRK